MQKTPLIGTGLSGLVGSKFTQMFADHYDFQNLDLSSGVDITDLSTVQNAISQTDAEVVIHFAAFTDVSKAHQEQGDKSGVVYKVNVEGTKNVAQATKEAGKHLIHISTAYVFDGEKEGMYVETDQRNPIEWYGQTKAWAEEEVEKSGVSFTMFRIDQPYRLDDFPKKDVYHRIIDDLKNNTLPPMFTDHYFTATRIEWFAEVLHQAVQQKFPGIYHATSEPKMSDYEFAVKIKDELNLPGEVKKGSLTEFLKTATRPYQKNTAMDSGKLKSVIG